MTPGLRGAPAGAKCLCVPSAPEEGRMAECFGGTKAFSTVFTAGKWAPRAARIYLKIFFNATFCGFCPFGERSGRIFFYSSYFNPDRRGRRRLFTLFTNVPFDSAGVAAGRMYHT